MSEAVKPFGDLDPLVDLGPEHPRRRLAEATVRCLDQTTLADLSLATVAGAAGLSRATLYRWFPDGRDGLLRLALAAEVAEFWRGLADAVADETTLEGRVTRGLMEGVRRVGDHSLLQRLVDNEAEEFAPLLDELDPQVWGLLAAYMANLLDRFGDDLQPGVDRTEASQYLATMILSYLGSPARIDFADQDQVAHLVRSQLLGGIPA